MHIQKGSPAPHSTHAQTQGAHEMEWRQLVRNTNGTGNQCLSRDGCGGTTTTWPRAECVLRVMESAVIGVSGSKTGFYGNKKLSPEGSELGRHSS